MKTQYDVIVVGGGVVGLALALGLAQQNLSVAIIDKNAAPSVDNTMPFTSRVSAISHTSQIFLEAIGAWQHIARKQIYTHMQVWDQDGFGKIAFNAEATNNLMNDHESRFLGQQNTSGLGHIIENDQINAALYNAIQKHNNVDVYYNTNIVDMSNADGAKVNMQSENMPVTQLSAKLLVGADGANSQVREHFNFKHTFWDYDHHAIVANVTTEQAHYNTAKQVFTPFGPLAFLPLAEANTSSIVFSQQSEQAQKLMQLDDADFEKALQVAIDNHYGKTTLLTKRISFPLRMRYARQWTSKSVALVGDAAHTIHPLAGQGANLGLADAQGLLSIIEQYPHKLGQTYALRKYERWRKAEAIKVIATMEGFKQLFDGEQTLKRLGRNTGLLMADKFPLVKQFFIKRASS